jgi:hypothetical protein
MASKGMKTFGIWIDLSDDEVLIRDTTPKHASKSVYLCWTACPLPALHIK